MDLIRQCEAQFLVPAAVPGSSDVFRLFRPVSLHLNLFPTESLLTTDMVNLGIARTAMDQPLFATQTVLKQDIASVSSSVPADVEAAAFKPLKMLPNISASHQATVIPAEEISGISCLFRAGGEVRGCLYKGFTLRVVYTR